MDAVSWDQFKNSKHPNIDEHAEDVMRAYSTGLHTFATMKSVLHGFLPCRQDKTLWEHYQWPESTPRILSKKGYSILGFSANPIFRDHNFREPWDDFYMDLGKNSGSGKRILTKILEKLPNYSEPIFLISLFVETHNPYLGEYDNKDDLGTAKQKQRDGVEYLDRIFGALYDRFPSNTEFYIFSDHGDLFGENKRGHNQKPSSVTPKDQHSCVGECDLHEVFIAKCVK